MVSNRFIASTVVRSGTLVITVVAGAWMIVHTQWYVAICLCLAAATTQIALLARLSTRSNRELARFLDAIAADDTSQSFSGLSKDSTYSELASAMTGVATKLRNSRSAREEQAHYLQTLVNHVPVALITASETGDVRLLNLAARRLFEMEVTQTAQFAKYGEQFAVGIESLQSVGSALVKMQRTAGNLQLKVAATDFVSGGVRRRLISLQNIENEMTAQEMTAWQSVIRIMAHEVMNSLTPISSLASTARDLVNEVLGQLAPEDIRAATLIEAHEALETVARRSQGLLHFVQNHRHLTKRLAAQSAATPMRRVFARLQRLLANDLAERGIHMTTKVEPETLEVIADTELLDQALINLVRNAVDALSDTPTGLVTLSARRDPEGRVAISVSDNGPGIPADHYEKVFVPFYTTKKHGSGIGLTIVRQIATAHGATVQVSQTPGGGATVRLRF